MKIVAANGKTALYCFRKRKEEGKMIYNEFQNIKLSALGMGNMRLPVVDGKDNCIDVEAAKQMLA